MPPDAEAAAALREWVEQADSLLDVSALDLSRVDGCHISQWDALVPLVPAVDGVLPVD